MVGVKDGRVVATHGDMQAEVNRGLNCVKGYFLSKIMYGADRLTTPLLRKRNGAYAKDGEFEPVSWDEALDVMAEQCRSEEHTSELQSLVRTSYAVSCSKKKYTCHGQPTPSRLKI